MSLLREFLRALRTTLDPQTWIEIMDDWTSRTRDRTGQDPDWEVEHRRARRRTQTADQDSESVPRPFNSPDPEAPDPLDGMDDKSWRERGNP